MELTQTRLKEILNYNKKTGIFTWRIKPAKQIEIGDIAGGFKDRYVTIRVAGKSYRGHRLAWFYVHGKWPKECIDHINNVKHDNRIKNLREATIAENNYNQSITSRNTSGFKGVRFTNSKWRAEVQHNKIYYDLGYLPRLNQLMKP